jgi:lactoylglutathione lyase
VTCSASPKPRTPAAGSPEHVELRLGGFTVGLGTVEAARRVHGVEAELVAAGVPTLQPPHDTGNNNRNALLRDPDGNLVEIVAKRGPS